MRISRDRTVVLWCTAASTVFVTWNISDECHLLGSWSAFLVCLLIWLISPYLVAFLGIFSKSATNMRASVLLSVGHAALFLVYALNGSSAERMGAGHMHLMLVPFLLLFITLSMFCVLLVRGLVLRVIGSRNSADAKIR